MPQVAHGASSLGESTRASFRRLCFSLAFPSPDARSLEAIDRLDDEAIEALFTYANRQRVAVPMALALAGAEREGRLTSARKAHIEERFGLRQELASLAFAAAEDFQTQAIEVAFLKGIGVERAYGDDYARQLYDVDVATPDLAIFWRAATLLLMRGFELGGLILRRDPASGLYYGGANLAKPSQTAPSLRAAFDFQIGGQPLSWSSTAPFGEVFWRGLARPFEGQALAVPSPVEATLLLLGEGLEQPALRVRDLLDLVFLAKRLTEDDVATLRARAEALGLGHEIARFRRDLAGYPEFVAEGSLQRLIAPAKGARSWLGRAPRPLRLALHHDLVYHRRERGLAVAIAEASKNLAREGFAEIHRRKRGLGALAEVSRRLPAKRLLETGTYVQLAWVSPEPRGETAWLKVGDASLLRTPLGVFRPSALAAE